MSRLSLGWLCGVVLMMIATTASADKIILNNKGVFEGEITKEVGDRITIRTAFGEVAFAKKTIAKIERMKWDPKSAASVKHAKNRRWAPTQLRRAKAGKARTTAKRPVRGKTRAVAMKTKRKG